MALNNSELPRIAQFYILDDANEMDNCHAIMPTIEKYSSACSIRFTGAVHMFIYFYILVKFCVNRAASEN